MRIMALKEVRSVLKRYYKEEIGQEEDEKQRRDRKIRREIKNVSLLLSVFLKVKLD